ncbi:MAG: plasmid pRiA4b ORF-3 family protein [Candidatus Jordarchaeum sp.]|uniref:plasmid pRiA4b ORF-3 family protein n=1 Tax=Candidatus Jordarchaeum sp. TaxID=2823881 RepID=UPI00404A3BEB
MKKKFEKVYQFKITLRDTKPPIWRRIQVPEIYTFWDLHVAIQNAMGWFDCHLHLFKIVDPKTGVNVEIGIPSDLPGDRETLPGWKQRIADYFSDENRVAYYTYDFGDNWEHIVKLEKILPADEVTGYPICIAGKRACPPEDCGGVWGYEELLEIIENPNHEEYEETLEWLGGGFDPEHFDREKVIFSDPDERRKYLFGR